MAEFTVERVGDVVGCRFDGESDMALFLPGSGDVLLANLAQWNSLKTPLSTAPLDSEPLDELRTTLLGLGAEV